MPITNALPTVTHDPTKTIHPSSVLFAFLPTGGTQENYRGKITGTNLPEPAQAVNYAYDSSQKLLTPNRIIPTKIEPRTFTIELNEPKLAGQLSMLNTRWRSGTGCLFVQDPDDVTNKVALLSNVFNCTITVSKDLSLPDDAFAVFEIKVQVAGTFTWTADATTT